MSQRPAVALVLLTALLTQFALADDAYFDLTIDKLSLTEGRLPLANPDAAPAETWWTPSALSAMRPYAVLDGPGDAIPAMAPDAQRPWTAGAVLPTSLTIRAEQPGDVSGRLFVPAADGKGVVMVKFKVPADQAKPDAKAAFNRAKRAHYEQLLRANVPGAAFFRRQAADAATALGEPRETPEDATFPNRPAELDDTYGLFTGGRALSENLQLDRVLRATTQPAPDAKDVDVKSIDGITVQPMDWTPLIKDLKPQTDPLAALIPADQHAIFFPSFDALLALMDEAERSGLPVLQSTEMSSQDAMTRQRYERQLGVAVNAMSRLLGPQLVNAIAVTGSDPYLRVGSDLTVLMEPKNAPALRTLLLAEIAAARQRTPLAKEASGEVGGVQYSGAESPDRSLHTYVAQIGQAVVLTNSLTQLQRIAAAHNGGEPSLAKEPEYTFFRDRYPRGGEEETGLLILSDATIRRWCGARWRIGDSRRTRAVAVMSDLQAASMDSLARNVQPGAGVLKSDFSTPDMGQLTLTSSGVTSSTYGRLDAMTPIAELSLDRVTAAEAEAYQRWRDTYQQNWRQYFDPIAVRFTVKPNRLAGDVTVMPLIWGTDYRDFIEITRGVKFSPGAGDPHDALLHLIVAFNREAQTVRAGENFASGMVPGLKVDPLGWIGKSIALYADDDPFWEELTAAKQPGPFMEKQFHRLPVGLRVEVSNGLKLAGFLVALRGFVDQTVPQMTVWENLKHNEQSYVKISASASARGENQELANAAIYYAATGQSLLLTLSEPLLKRALDRETARAPTTQPGATAAPPPSTQAWLGASVALSAQAKIFDLLMHTSRQASQLLMQSLAWSNLPALNEWKRRYPNQDPLQLHERIWGVRLTDPAAGSYAWNEQWQTMESSLYGHPGQPKEGPAIATPWSGLMKGSFGLTFEDQGLRARAEMERKVPGR